MTTRLSVKVTITVKQPSFSWSLLATLLSYLSDPLEKEGKINYLLKHKA